MLVPIQTAGSANVGLSRKALLQIKAMIYGKTTIKIHDFQFVTVET